MATPKTPKKRKYRVTPLQIHTKFCVDEQLRYVNGQWIVEKWLFTRKDYRCGVCGRADDVVFMRLPTGVYLSCTWCGFTEKVEPRDPDTREEKAFLLETRNISIVEARQIATRDKRIEFFPALTTRGRPKRETPSPEELI